MIMLSDVQMLQLYQQVHGCSIKFHGEDQGLHHHQRITKHNSKKSTGFLILAFKELALIKCRQGMVPQIQYLVETVTWMEDDLL